MNNQVKTLTGGRDHGTVVEMPGPGRPPVDNPVEKARSVAMVLTALFGPLGLCYASMRAGLLATVATVVVLGYAEMGFLPLLLIWPLTVAVAPALLVRGRRPSVRTTSARRW